MRLSPTMETVVEYMREHGGSIHRYPGGFWARKGWVLHGGTWFGTNSVHALVLRKVAEYSEWQEGRSGRFPIEAKLLPPDSTASTP